MGSEGLNLAVSPCHEIRLLLVEGWRGIISKEHKSEAIIQRWVEQRSAVSRSTCGQRAAPSLASCNFRTPGPRVIPPF